MHKPTVEKTDLNKGLARTVIAGIGSTYFTLFIFIFFAIESLWMAFSTAFPMLYDESVHFGIIRIFSHQWLPFFSHQAKGAAVYGAVVRDPSYMYRYLMSFPYRVFAYYVHGQYAQVMFLRCINIGIFTASLVLFRKLLLKVGISSKAMVNGVMLMFILTPIVPLAAAQINYDSLFLLVTAVSILLMVKLREQMISSHSVSLRRLTILTAICFLGAQVKFVFLAIFLALAIYFTYLLHTYVGGKTCMRQIYRQFLSLRRSVQVGIIATYVGCTGLFIQSYGLNIVHYHSPIPQCNQVLSVPTCMPYVAWHRNYILAQANKHNHTSLLKKLNAYITVWPHAMLRSLFFTAGPNNTTANALPIPQFIEYAMGVCALALAIWYGRRLYASDATLRFYLLIIGIYLIVLFIKNFRDYINLGLPIGVQGRYLLPIFPFVYLIVALMVRMFLSWIRTQYVKVTVFGILLMGMLEGGGALTFILQSNSTWYWQQATVIRINHDARDLLQHIVIR